MNFPTTRLRFVCEEPLKYGANAPAQFDDPSWPRFIRITDITEHGQLKDETFRSLPPEQAAPYLLDEGDLLLARSGSIGRSFIYRAEWGLVCHAGYLIRARVGPNYYPQFVYWALNSDEYWAWIERVAIRSTIQNVSAEKYSDFALPSPRFETQKRIASFLDEKTAQIDALIAKKRLLLERLAEKRQAIIVQAVTKGLDTTAPMKDSGVEWLGQIPAHWQVRKIKYGVSHVVDCLHTTPNYDGDVLYPAIRTADLDRGRLLLSQARLVSEDIYLERIQRLEPIGGDVLYSREGERFGMAALVPEDVRLCLGQRMMMFRAHEDSYGGYLMWALNSEAIYQQVTLFSGGSTSPHINIGDINNFFVPQPSLVEQQKIAKAVSRECDNVDQIVAEVDKSIGKLLEYRSAIITKAVSGQIEVLR